MCEHGIPIQAVLEVGYGGRTEDAVAHLAPHLDAMAEAAEIEHLEGTSLDGLAVITGTDRFMNSLEAHAWAIVTSSSLPLAACHLPVPDVLITTESVQHGKPHPEPYLKAAEALGIDPKDCLAFEDADNGVNSALAAGCSVVVVGDGSLIRHESILFRVPTFEGLELGPHGSLLWGGRTMPGQCW